MASHIPPPEWGRTHIRHNRPGTYLSVPEDQEFTTALREKYSSTQVVWNPTCEEWWISDCVMDSVALLCKEVFGKTPE